MQTLRKILVVDDDPVVGKSFDRVLSSRGYAVVTAKTGIEALHKIDNEQYDAVFTDIKMPGMDGIAVAEQIRKTQPWMPIVIVSGYATEENEARAKAAGVSGIMRKPLTPEMIENGADAAFVKAAPIAVEAANETVAPIAAPRTITSWAKNVAMLLAAPFVGLAYVIAFPFVGLGMLAWIGTKAAVGRYS